MRNFSHFFVILISGSVLLSSCASVLAPSHQDVKIHTGSDEAEVSVNGNEAGQGETVTASVEKDHKPKQLRVEKEGYVPQFSLMIPDNRHPLIWLSWTVFGPTSAFLVPLSDRGPKSYEYEDEYEVNSTSFPARSREEGQRYMFLFETSFDISADDFNLNTYTYNNYKRGRSPMRHHAAEESLSIQGEGPTQRLNELLHEQNFIDTTENIFRDQTNTLYISAEMSDLEIDQVILPFQVHPRTFYKAKGNITWEIYDVYQQKLYEEIISTTSAEFYSNTVENSVGNAISHVIYQSLFEFLDSDEVNNYLEIDEDRTVDFEPLAINRGMKPATINQAQEATVTIKNDDSHGSGCVVSTDGYIVTNFHVVAGDEDDEIIVLLDGQREFEAELVRKNKYDDVALIKIDHTFDYTYDFSSGAAYPSGMDVYSIGTPASVQLGQTVNRGIISGSREYNERTWIQSDVSVSPGNSGGSLVNENGEMIGLVTAKMTGYSVEGITFAMPADRVVEGLNLQFTEMP